MSTSGPADRARPAPIIRHAAAADLDAILAITNREILFGEAHMGVAPLAPDDLAREFAAAAAGPRAIWPEIADAPAIYPWLVADIAGTGVVGFAKASPWKLRGGYAHSTEIGVYISPPHQRRGLARALYAVLLPALRDAGFRCVLAGIAMPNDASVRLHESFGMRHNGTLPCVARKHGRARDVGYWCMTYP